MFVRYLGIAYQLNQSIFCGHMPVMIESLERKDVPIFLLHPTSFNQAWRISQVSYDATKIHACALMIRCYIHPCITLKFAIMKLRAGCLYQGRVRPGKNETHRRQCCTSAFVHVRTPITITIGVLVAFRRCIGPLWCCVVALWCCVMALW